MSRLIYKSTKTFEHAFPCCFRQWRAQSHCRFLHGYALTVRLTFEGELADDWVVDFGGFKGFKGWLESKFDHKTLVAEDDPSLTTFCELAIAGIIDVTWVKATGCERFAQMILEAGAAYTKDKFGERVQLVEVEVREHEANSAIVRPD